MVEAKHTKGPWTVGYGGGITGPTTPRVDGPCVGGRDVKYAIVTVPGIVARSTLAICPDQELAKGSGEANARLIAAAPELLASLKDCISRLVAAFPDCEEYKPIQDARAAIAKAEGRL